MGIEGPGIFDDYIARDVAADYRALLEDQVDDREAALEVLVEHAKRRKYRADRRQAILLGLASEQWRLGRLDDATRDAAVASIDSGEAHRPWEPGARRTGADPDELPQRVRALQRLRDQLTGPQPERKVIRRAWRHYTDLGPGAVLVHEEDQAPTLVFRVLRIEKIRTGSAPVLERLVWDEHGLPDITTIDTLPHATHLSYKGDANPTRVTVKRDRKSYPDYPECGYRVVGQLEVRPGDDTHWAHTITWWPNLRKSSTRDRHS